MRLLLTGTPGCGKTVLAKKLARLLKAELVDVNGLVEKRRIYRLNKRGEKVVDLKKLRVMLAKLLSCAGKNVVVDSHLLCEMRLPCERIVVLRCDPLKLKKRLEKRGYPAWKVKDNMLAEMLDYCLIKAEGNYPKAKILQIDFSKPLPAEMVLGFLERKNGDSVDWMGKFGNVSKSLGGFE